ncbi:hypothetical protein V1520DRAFT_283414 [Lipomyces starkeyi]|uniref:Uncharacterized protein n=1 Tax=Lipomyces starkeyi NRRL Y-11557 TaxID=675824 RepID=A0A1E3Q2B0_LIPST|nr:hypothetical protein LIPSTDRAFT_64076 [Lipomyces starkeyi NRRL Y-11557]
MKSSQSRSTIAVLALVLVRNIVCAPCTSDDITNMDVSGCDCPSQFPSPVTDLTCIGPAQVCSQTCGNPQMTIQSRSQLTQCGQGCITANSECNGCYIWFHSLCSCIRDLQHASTTTGCSPSENLHPGHPNQPIWMLLNAGDLITTTQLLPGILQLNNAPDPDGGWRLGQRVLQQGHSGQTYNRVRGSLAMNSVATRSEEQVHIHVCDNPVSKIRDKLSSLWRGNYGTLQPVPLTTAEGFRPGSEMSCRVSPNSGAVIDMARDISGYIGSLVAPPASCAAYYVGAGVITDANDYTWACVTTGTRSAEELFCHT